MPADTTQIDYNLPYATMRSGRRWYFTAPRVEDVDWSEIAWGLSRQPRYNGQTDTAEPYSIAQHSCIVADHVETTFEPAYPYALLHDAPESPLGDIIRPVKGYFSHYAPIEDLERINEDVIHRAAGLKPPSAGIRSVVADADMRVFATEWRQFWPGQPLPHGVVAEPLVLKIKVWDRITAESEFLARVDRVLSRKLT